MIHLTVPLTRQRTSHHFVFFPRKLFLRRFEVNLFDVPSVIYYASLSASEFQIKLENELKKGEVVRT